MDFLPGQRIACASTDGLDFGTIRYVGPVANTEKDWCGVEWDDSARGRHNGTYKGVCYFKGSHPTGSSFVRPTKLLSGISLKTALLARYDSVNDIDSDSLLFSTTARRPYETLSHIGLQQSCILDTEDLNDLYLLLPVVQCLDLSGNAIRQWRTLFDLATQLEGLHTVDLSRNPLDSVLPQGLPVIQALQAHLPSLQELHLEDCDLDSLTVAQGSEILPSFGNLELLNLQGNRLTDWKDLDGLSILPRLTTLICGGNPFKTILPSPSQSGFSSLTHLSLAHNVIDKWEYVAHLNSLSALVNLRYTDSPVTLETGSANDVRSTLIAILPGIAILNGSEISAVERREAELWYLKTHGPAYALIANLPPDHEAHVTFYRDHPAFARLMNSHQWQHCPEKPKSIKLRSQLLELVIMKDGEGGPGLIKRVPDRLTVGRLKAMIQAAMNIPVVSQHLAVSLPQ
eukprot:Ihof_evm8s351 gene=Ihof_evmTU8s351